MQTLGAAASPQGDPSHRENGRSSDFKAAAKSAGPEGGGKTTGQAAGTYYHGFEGEEGSGFLRGFLCVSGQRDLTTSQQEMLNFQLRTA